MPLALWKGCVADLAAKTLSARGAAVFTWSSASRPGVAADRGGRDQCQELTDNRLSQQAWALAPERGCGRCWLADERVREDPPRILPFYALAGEDSLAGAKKTSGPAPSPLCWPRPGSWSRTRSVRRIAFPPTTFSTPLSRLGRRRHQIALGIADRVPAVPELDAEGRVVGDRVSTNRRIGLSQGPQEARECNARSPGSRCESPPCRGPSAEVFSGLEEGGQRTVRAARSASSMAFAGGRTTACRSRPASVEVTNAPRRPVDRHPIRSRAVVMIWPISSTKVPGRARRRRR